MNIFIFNLILLLFINLNFGKETLGLVTKTKGKVEYQIYTSKKFTKKISKGLGLYSDDRIRTGEDGFSIYRYLDDASSIKILKNSDIQIQGRVNDNNIEKNIEVYNGLLNFNITKQNNDIFTIVTPTSVATVKGTNFWLICNGIEGDKFLGVEGEVEVKNIESGNIVILNESSTVISSNNGSISTQSMTSEDFQEIEDLDDESGEYEDFEIDTGFNDGSQNSESNLNADEERIIRIQFEDAFNNSKEIIIKYK
jgi:hypothetical protein